MRSLETLSPAALETAVGAARPRVVHNPGQPGWFTESAPNGYKDGVPDRCRFSLTAPARDLGYPPFKGKVTEKGVIAPWYCYGRKKRWFE